MSTDTERRPDPASEDLVEDAVVSDTLLAQLVQLVHELMDKADLAEYEIEELKRHTSASPRPAGPSGASSVRWPDRHPWTRTERAENDWHELVAWVDEICAAHDIADLPVCWPAHEHLANEWEAARAAWYAAAAVHAQQPSSAMWNWYQYTWHPLRRQMTDHTSCRNGHIDDPVAPTTAQAFIPTQASRGYWADDVDADGVVADLVELADAAAASIPEDEYHQAHTDE